MKKLVSTGARLCAAASVCVLLGLSGAYAQDVSYFEVGKITYFEQTGPGAPMLATNVMPFSIGASVAPTEVGTVNSASVRTPAGVTNVLSRLGDVGAEFGFQLEGSFATQAELDAAFGAGGYRFIINTDNDGVRMPVLTLPVRSPANELNAAPHISNWSAAQEINADQAFPLNWDALANGTAADSVDIFIVAESDDTLVFESPSFGEPGALNGLSRSISIPANTLQPGQAYRAFLSFDKSIFNFSVYPGAVGVVGYSRETQFALNTVSPFGRLQFSAANFVVNENGGTATITVTRTTGSEGTVSVNFQADIGTASAGTDFTPTTGVLTFGPGVTERTFTVTILNDGQTEGAETIRLSLFTPTGGATLGSANVAGLIILDDETPSGSDAAFYLIAKGQAFAQTNASTPVLVPGMPFGMIAEVQESFPGSLLGATLRLPNTTIRMLEQDSEDGGFELNQQFVSKSALDAAFGAGNYIMTIRGLLDGTNVATLTLPAETGANAAPNNPRISNWADAQSLDASAPFTLTWDAFSGGTSNDFIQISIEDESGNDIFGSGDLFGLNALNGTNVSMLLPANTLNPGGIYEGRLLFARVVDLETNSYPGALGVAAYFKETEFTLKAGVTPPPQGRVQFAAGAFSVSEGNALASFTVTRTGGSQGAISVQFTTSQGSATAGADYTATSGPLNFADGETEKTFTLPIVEDFNSEGNETVLMSLSNPTGGAILGSPGSAVMTILDNEVAAAGRLQFSGATYTVTEAGPAASVMITRTGGTAGTVAVDFATSDGTATSGPDYTAIVSNVTFAAGVASRTIAIPIFNDPLDEANETVLLALSNPTGGAGLGLAGATLSITDNDVAGNIAFSTATYSVSETGVVARVIVTRAGGLASAATVELGVAGGTATADVDYTFVAGVLTFAANETKKTNDINIINDPDPDGNETVNLTLRNPGGGATLGAVSTAVLTILDDETSLQFSRAVYTNSEAGPMATITVNRTGFAGKAVAVNFATVAGGTANASPDPAADYLGTNGTLVLPAGILSKSFAVRIVNDTLVELDETVFLQLSSPSNALLGPIANAELAIRNNDFGGEISFSATNFIVTEAGSVALVTVKRTKGEASGVTVNFTTADETATAGADYTGVTSNLTFAAGELTKTIKVPVINDTVQDGSEKFRVLLSNATGGASVGPISSATVSVTDNDVAGTVQFSLAGYSVGENGGNALIVIKRAGGAAGNVTVNFFSEGGTATAGLDYTAVMTSVSFGAGELSKTNLVPILQDPSAEGSETVQLRLRDVTGGAKLGAITNAVLTIRDDELN